MKTNHVTCIKSNHFSEAAQRLGVYTATDYINILTSLIQDWKIDSINYLTDNGERARDYIMALPARLTRLSERITPKVSAHQFSWIRS